MTTARNGQAAVLLRDGRVLILGGAVPPEGECGMGCVLPLTASVEIYDPKTDTFHRNGSLVHPRTGADAALLRDGRVLVAGGYVESGTAQYLEIYDPATGRSTAVKPAAGNPALPNGYATALLSDGRALLVGGWYGGTPPSTSNATRIFDPAKRTFSRGPLLARPRQYAGATVLRDGRVLVLGGERFEGDGGVTDHSAELIDPRRSDARSTHLESASTFLRGQAPMTAVLADGRVLLAGIGDSVPSGACAAAPAAAVFDPATMSFAQAGLLHTPRAGFAAIPLRDGRALLIGGVDASCNAVSAVEAFDPASRSFTVVSTDLPDLRQGLTATRLNDDRVLVTSGSGTPSTWLLEP